MIQTMIWRRRKVIVITVPTPFPSVIPPRECMLQALNPLVKKSLDCNILRLHKEVVQSQKRPHIAVHNPGSGKTRLFAVGSSPLHFNPNPILADVLVKNTSRVFEQLD